MPKQGGAYGSWEIYLCHRAGVRVLLVVAQIRWMAALTSRFHSQAPSSLPAARNLPDLDGDLARECLVPLPDRGIALADGHEARRNSQCGQYGQRGYPATRKTHRPPMLAQMLTDERVLDPVLFPRVPRQARTGTDDRRQAADPANDESATIAPHDSPIRTQRHPAKRAE